MTTTSEFAYGPPPAGGFYAFQPVVVPVDLDTLQGPLEGVVRLPSHIDTSARARYDLADPRRREMLYAVVILEAWKDEDFAAWLNRDALIDSWPRLSLPRPVRAKWEALSPSPGDPTGRGGHTGPVGGPHPFQVDVARIALAAAEHGLVTGDTVRFDGGGRAQRTRP